MRQVIRRVIDRKGKVLVTEYPAPHLGADQVLVQNLYTLISTGTEMSTLAKTIISTGLAFISHLRINILVGSLEQIYQGAETYVSRENHDRTELAGFSAS